MMDTYNFPIRTVLYCRALKTGLLRLAENYYVRIFVELAGMAALVWMIAEATR